MTLIMRIKMLHVLAICCFALMLAADSFAALSPIEQDVKAGIISENDAVIYRALAIVRPEAVPTRYLSEVTVPGKCATDEVREATKIIMSDSTAYKSFRDILSRPVTQVAYQSPQGYFWLHYDTSGTHAVPLADGNGNGVPDYIDHAASYADSVWRYEVQDLGFLPPPADGTQGGGLDQYDIYFQRLTVYGYTQLESPGPNPWYDYSSHVVVHNNFNGFPPNQDPEGNVYGALKVTIAHEFCHALQFAYDAGEEIYFMEETSTWMEDMAFPATNDNYNYLPYFYSVPEQGLQKTGNHEYAAFIWPKYLQERFGPAIIREIWSECRYNSAIGSWSYVLDSAGSSLQDEFTRFLVWNYHTGDRATPTTFVSGADYPQVSVMRYTDVVPDSNRSSSEPPEPLASNYIVINNYSGSRGILTIDFTGVVTANWGIGYVIDHGNGQFEDSVCTTLQGTSARISIPHFENVLKVAFIPGVTSSYGTSWNYQYTIFWRTPGDFNGDNVIDISDAVAGINYIFGDGPVPQPLQAMDANCDGYNDISDVTYLITYIFGGGPAPCY